MLQKLSFSAEVVASMSPAPESDGTTKRHTVDQHDSIVGQYKELIREQVGSVLLGVFP